MGKQKKDAGKLEAAADAQNAPADAADDAAVAAATGQAAEAGSGDAAAGDEKPDDAKNAGQVQGAVDVGANAEDAAKPEPDEGEFAEVEAVAPMSLAQFAREVSGMAATYASREPLDPAGFTWEYLFNAEEADIMADFVLENPDAPLLAMYKHLEIQKSLPATIPSNADMMALSVFRHACLAALEFMRCELAKPVPQSSGWPGEQALQVTHSPFEATGFTPSR